MASIGYDPQVAAADIMFCTDRFIMLVDKGQPNRSLEDELEFRALRAKMFGYVRDLCFRKSFFRHHLTKDAYEKMVDALISALEFDGILATHGDAE